MSALAQEEITQTAAWIASLQLPSGMVPWYRGGHADPWNHVEATMALAAGGRWGEVERAFDWLAGNQLEDGSWCTFYLADGVIEPRRDPNVCAYLATGARWCWQLSGDDWDPARTVADARAGNFLVLALPAPRRRNCLVRRPRRRHWHLRFARCDLVVPTLLAVGGPGCRGPRPPA
jgi:hypothetical protein